MTGKEVSAKSIKGKITAIEGRILTIETQDRDGEWITREYELAESSPLEPEGLLDCIDDYLTIIIVNDKIYNLK